MEQRVTFKFGVVEGTFSNQTINIKSWKTLKRVMFFMLMKKRPILLDEFHGRKLILREFLTHRIIFV